MIPPSKTPVVDAFGLRVSGIRFRKTPPLAGTTQRIMELSYRQFQQVNSMFT